MIILLLLILVLVSALALTVYLLGFRLGGNHWQDELLRVRSEATHASRQMHELTKTAFVAMAEEAERRHRT